MHDFVSHVLRRYYEQTEWNPYNSYLHLTSSSHAVLDFSTPTGLSLSISASPSPPFLTTYRLRALPSLSGALGYIFASIEDDDGRARGLTLGGSSRDIRFKDVVEQFRITEAPRYPIGKEQIFQGGKRVDTRDFLMYGCMHVPSARVDALFTTRISPTWQLLMTAISMPPRSSNRGGSHVHAASERGSDVSAASTAPVTSGGFPPGSTNMQINLQRDTGRWFSEYSYSVDDGLLGFRVLHNFGLVGQSQDSQLSAAVEQDQGYATLLDKRSEDENLVEGGVGGGLQGRFSMGAELFFSPLEKSAGLSTGVRFSTLPIDTVSGSIDGISSSEPILQPPTTITATLNPMMGHLSTAYAAKMTRDIVACSRFDFNVYSYDSDLTLGMEYWLRSASKGSARLQRSATDGLEPDLDSSPPLPASPRADEQLARLDRQLSARSDTNLSVRDTIHVPHDWVVDHSIRPWSLRDQSIQEENTASLVDPTIDQSGGTLTEQAINSKDDSTQANGVIKARLSTSGNAALLWEGRLRNCLVSFGLKANLSSDPYAQGPGTRRPLQSVGLDIVYFTQSEQERLSS